MKIKQVEERAWWRGFGRRRWLVGTGLLSLLAVTALASMYYGMVLVKTGRSMTLKDWASGVADTKLGVVSNYLGGLSARPERFEIDIGFENFQRLAHKREEALALGRLYTTSDDWVPARIRHGDRNQRVELRLKGDLSDHWRRPDKWSFKVKVKGDATILGMKRFALQDPRTRKFLNEWVMHRLQEHLGLIALRYEFVDVTVNGKHQGIFALEENFDKRLVENNARREGPIVKFDQWFYWRHDPGMAPELAGGSVTAYEDKKYTGEGELAGQFEVARSLLDFYRVGRLSASEVFDVGRLAAFFAICDLAGYDHATRIDNLKFYYNPVTSLLEPVGYDFNHIQALEGDQALLAARVLPRSESGHDPSEWTVGLFGDARFLEAYVATLERLASPDFLDAFFASIEEALERNLAILHKSYPWYEWHHRATLESNLEYVRRFLAPEKSLQAYLVALDAGAGEVELMINTVHCLPVDLVTLVSPSGRRYSPVETASLPGYSPAEPVRYRTVRFTAAEAPEDHELERTGWTLEHVLQGTRTSRHDEVHAEPPYRPGFPAGDVLRTAADPEGLPWLTVDRERGRLTLRPGRWELRESVVLPAGWVVAAGGGTELDLLDGATLVSHSPLSWAGAEGDPVRLVSSDGTGRGLVVLQASERSTLRWVELVNLSNPDHAGWELTGAVTFYESPVDLLDCRFVENRCEDALNIIRSDFRIESCLFERTPFDAFDADFCTGAVVDTAVLDCGDDAVDFSGSVVELFQLRFERVGDKCISVGERSTATGAGIRVVDAEIVAASKDLSELDLEDVSIEGARVGFAAFRKKSEFGPGTIRLRDLRASNVQEPYLLERGSTILVDGEPAGEERENIEKLLYGGVYGKP